MQCVFDVLLEKLCQPFAVADVQGLRGKVLQYLLRVVGTTEECSVESRPHATMNLGRGRDQQHAEGCAHGYRCPRSGGEVARERLPEPKRQTHRSRKNQEDESALDDKISCAPF